MDTHLQLISFATAPVVLLIVHLLKRRSGGAIANEPTVPYHWYLEERAGAAKQDGLQKQDGRTTKEDKQDGLQKHQGLRAWSENMTHEQEQQYSTVNSQGSEGKPQKRAPN